MDHSRTPLSELRPHNQSSVGELDEEEQRRFNKLVTRGKEAAAQGHIKQALELNKKATEIYRSDKIIKRIHKMEAYLAEYGADSEEDEEEGDDMIHVGNNFYLFRDLYDKLYSHQREGILWMWKLHKAKKGGILGDDMGLGKTIQVISFLSGLFDAQQINAVLIVLPVAVIINWEKEFEKWSPGIRVMAFHGMSKRERERSLGKVHRRGGVVLTSYGMVINNKDVLGDNNGREFVWDYIILDEGHKIKNPSTKGAKSLHSLAARHRLILTGTPVQNNLKEMWSLFDWTHQGTLLGTARTFAMEYEGPIVRARQKDATAGEQRLGQEIASSLKKLITPYFMRRTKAEVTSKKKAAAAAGTGEGDHKAPAMPTFTRKNDLVTWVFLSDLQQKIYEEFVQTEEVRDLLNSTRSPLTALVVLKKICDHPRLLTLRQCVSLGIDVPGLHVRHASDMDEATARQCAATRIDHVPVETLIRESGKMVFLVELLDNLRQSGHRALVFSQSRKMLDMIQKVIKTRGHKVARLDGTIRLLAEREDIIKKFSTDTSYSVFLLTTQVGGVGLTLTSADRVIIFDPSWNPATDAQAVDRAFRIGQEKNVVIYRLITCGSIEEKIYRRQIFKDSITKQTTGDSSNPYRYFSRQELHELFVLDNPRHSSTQVQLMEIHTNDKRRTDTTLDAHIAFLHTLEMFGISDHDLMFSQEAQNDEDDEDDITQGHDYINSRVSKAQQAISLESEENFQMTQQLGKYPGHEANKERQRRPVNDDLPGPSRPRIDVEALHQRSMEMDDSDVPSSDDDDDHSGRTGDHSGRTDDDINQSMSELVVQDSPQASQSSMRSPTPPRPAPVLVNPRLVAETLRPRHLADIVTIADTPQRDKRSSNEFSPLPGAQSKKGRTSPLEAGGLDACGLDADDCDVMEMAPIRRHRGEARTARDEEIVNIPDTPVDSRPDSPSMTEDISLSPSVTDAVSLSPAEPRGTPSTFRKRRPSVCNPNTPTTHRKFTEDQLKTCLNNLGEPADVVSEEICFSEPQATHAEPSPSVQSQEASPSVQSQEASPCSADTTTQSLNVTDMNYENFARRIHMNSTVLPDLAARRGREQDFIEEEEDEEEEENEADESQIGMKRPTRAAVLESSEEEMDDDEVDDKENTPQRGSVAHTPQGATPQHRLNTPQSVVGTPRQHSNTPRHKSMVQSNTPHRTPAANTPQKSDVLTPGRALGEHKHQAMNTPQRSGTPVRGPSTPQRAGVGTPQAAHVDEDVTEPMSEDEEIMEDPSVAEEEADVEEENDEDEEEDDEETEDEEEEEELSEDQKNRYIELMTRSRTLYKAGDFVPALEFGLDALEIYRGDDRATGYVKKLADKLRNSVNK